MVCGETWPAVSTASVGSSPAVVGVSPAASLSPMTCPMPLPRAQTLASPTRLRSLPACCPSPSCLMLLTPPCSARSSALVRLGKSGLSGQHCSQAPAPPAASRPLDPWCTTRIGLFSGKPASPPPRRVSHTQPSASASPSPMPSCSLGRGHTDSSPTWLHHARLVLKNPALP